MCAVPTAISTILVPSLPSLPLPSLPSLPLPSLPSLPSGPECTEQDFADHWISPRYDELLDEVQRCSPVPFQQVGHLRHTHARTHAVQCMLEAVVMESHVWLALHRVGVDYFQIVYLDVDTQVRGETLTGGMCGGGVLCGVR